jgi:hypothetical protein
MCASRPFSDKPICKMCTTVNHTLYDQRMVWVFQKGSDDRLERTFPSNKNAPTNRKKDETQATHGRIMGKWIVFEMSIDLL